MLKIGKIYIFIYLFVLMNTLDKSKNKSEYSFLIITDIHQNNDNLQKIISESKGKQYDYVICTGDAVSVPIDKNDDPPTAIKYTTEFNRIIYQLEQIAPVIWVPGNHEPGNAYGRIMIAYQLKGTNLHKKVLKLDDNLVLVGLGGSVPILEGGKYFKGYVPFSTLDYNNFKYAGYPYNVDKDYKKSDELFDKDLAEQISKAKEYGNEVQMILLSHLGPSYTSTNLLVEDGNIMYLGSNKLGLAFERENFILNIHGHTHTGKGLVNLPENKYVVNPGAATLGHYGEVSIKKRDNGKWYVESVNLKDI